MLCLYTTQDQGYQELDYSALSDEQALAIADMIHQVLLDHSEIRQVAVFSMRLSQALRHIEPKLVTVKDLKEKPLSSWRDHTFLDRHLYTELRETMRPFGVRLPAWELLP